jgi:hypothetical protein
MASAIGTTLKNVKSAIQKIGGFDSVMLAEPKSAPGKGVTVAVFFASMGLAGGASGLSKGTAVYVFTIRVYTDMLREPVETIDPDLVAAVDKILDALGADFDLGSTVRNIDFLGSEGTPLGVEAGYVEVSGKMCRIADITLPLIVNDTVTWTA